MRILLVEDDTVLRDVMVRSLADAGHRVDVSTNVEDADHLWRVQPFDAVLLDLNLPATASPTSGLASGLTALRQARARGDRTPVLVLTARDRTEERIAGLDAGADDYLGKPFALSELRARVTALGRRGPLRRDRAIAIGPLVVDLEGRRVRLEGRALPLTAKELAIVDLLATRSGNVVGREDLLESVWGEVNDSTRASLDVLIARIRQKLGARASLLQTVRGVGYLLGAD